MGGRPVCGAASGQVPGSAGTEASASGAAAQDARIDAGIERRDVGFSREPPDTLAPVFALGSRSVSGVDCARRRAAGSVMAMVAVELQAVLCRCGQSRFRIDDDRSSGIDGPHSLV
jgi:hypothetical protein